MSNDLISRSNLISIFQKNKEQLQKGLGKDAEFAYMTADYVMSIINSAPTAYDVNMVVEQLEEIQQYRSLEKEIHDYDANVDIKTLIRYFVETIFKGEKHEKFCVLTNKDAEELEQYLALGTVEDIKKIVEYLGFNGENDLINDMSLFNQYRMLGTVEELREAMEKQRAKTPNIWGDGYSDGYPIYDMYECPNCGEEYEIYGHKYDFCPNCGQHLDWREEE